MTDDDRLTVPLSRLKLIIWSVGFLALTFASLLPFLGRYTHYTPNFGATLSIVGFLLFGAGTWFSVRKLLDMRPGLVLDRDGVTDNSNIFRSSSAAWSNVRDIRMFWGRGGRSLSLYIDDPASDSPFHRVMSVSPNTLGISFGELEKVVRSYWQKYGSAG